MIFYDDVSLVPTYTYYACALWDFHVLCSIVNSNGVPITYYITTIVGDVYHNMIITFCVKINDYITSNFDGPETLVMVVCSVYLCFMSWYAWNDDDNDDGGGKGGDILFLIYTILRRRNNSVPNSPYIYICLLRINKTKWKPHQIHHHHKNAYIAYSIPNKRNPFYKTILRQAYYYVVVCGALASVKWNWK